MVAAHALNPSSQVTSQFDTSLVNKASFKTARAVTKRNSLKTKQKSQMSDTNTNSKVFSMKFSFKCPQITVYKGEGVESPGENKGQAELRKPEMAQKDRI